MRASQHSSSYESHGGGSPAQASTPHATTPVPGWDHFRHSVGHKHWDPALHADAGQSEAQVPVNSPGGLVLRMPGTQSLDENAIDARGGAAVIGSADVAAEIESGDHDDDEPVLTQGEPANPVRASDDDEPQATQGCAPAHPRAGPPTLAPAGGHVGQYDPDETEGESLVPDAFAAPMVLLPPVPQVPCADETVRDTSSAADLLGMTEVQLPGWSTAMDVASSVGAGDTDDERAWRAHGLAGQAGVGDTEPMTGQGGTVMDGAETVPDRGGETVPDRGGETAVNCDESAIEVTELRQPLNAVFTSAARREGRPCEWSETCSEDASKVREGGMLEDMEDAALHDDAMPSEAAAAPGLGEAELAAGTPPRAGLEAGAMITSPPSDASHAMARSFPPLGVPAIFSQPRPAPVRHTFLGSTEPASADTFGSGQILGGNAHVTGGTASQVDPILRSPEASALRSSAAPTPAASDGGSTVVSTNRGNSQGSVLRSPLASAYGSASTPTPAEALSASKNEAGAPAVGAEADESETVPPVNEHVDVQETLVDEGGGSEVGAGGMGEALAMAAEANSAAAEAAQTEAETASDASFGAADEAAAGVAAEVIAEGVNFIGDAAPAAAEVEVKVDGEFAVASAMALPHAASDPLVECNTPERSQRFTQASHPPLTPHPQETDGPGPADAGDVNLIALAAPHVGASSNASMLAAPLQGDGGAARGSVGASAVASPPRAHHDAQEEVSQQSPFRSPGRPESNTQQQPTPQSSRRGARADACESGEVVAMTVDMQLIPIATLTSRMHSVSAAVGLTTVPVTEDEAVHAAAEEHALVAPSVGASQVGAAGVLLTMQQQQGSPSPSSVVQTQASAAGLTGAAALTAMHHQPDAPADAVSASREASQDWPTHVSQLGEHDVDVSQLFTPRRQASQPHPQEDLPCPTNEARLPVVQSPDPPARSQASSQPAADENVADGDGESPGCSVPLNCNSVRAHQLQAHSVSPVAALNTSSDAVERVRGNGLAAQYAEQLASAAEQSNLHAWEQSHEGQHQESLHLSSLVDEVGTGQRPDASTTGALSPALGYAEVASMDETEEERPHDVAANCIDTVEGQSSESHFGAASGRQDGGSGEASEVPSASDVNGVVDEHAVSDSDEDSPQYAVMHSRLRTETNDSSPYQPTQVQLIAPNAEDDDADDDADDEAPRAELLGVAPPAARIASGRTIPGATRSLVNAPVDFAAPNESVANSPSGASAGMQPIGDEHGSLLDARVMEPQGAEVHAQSNSADADDAIDEDEEDGDGILLFDDDELPWCSPANMCQVTGRTSASKVPSRQLSAPLLSRPGVARATAAICVGPINAMDPSAAAGSAATLHSKPRPANAKPRRAANQRAPSRVVDDKSREEVRSKTVTMQSSAAEPTADALARARSLQYLRTHSREPTDAEWDALVRNASPSAPARLASDVNSVAKAPTAIGRMATGTSTEGEIRGSEASQELSQEQSQQPRVDDLLAQVRLRHGVAMPAGSPDMAARVKALLSETASGLSAATAPAASSPRRGVRRTASTVAAAPGPPVERRERRPRRPYSPSGATGEPVNADGSACMQTRSRMHPAHGQSTTAPGIAETQPYEDEEHAGCDESANHSLDKARPNDQSNPASARLAVLARVGERPREHAGAVTPPSHGAGSVDAAPRVSPRRASVPPRGTLEVAGASVAAAAALSAVSRMPNTSQPSPSRAHLESSGGGRSGRVSLAGQPRSIGAQVGVGSVLEVQSQGEWRPAKVIETRGGDAGGDIVPQVFVHFDGRARKYDEWLPLSSKKLRNIVAPPRAPGSVASASTAPLVTSGKKRSASATASRDAQVKRTRHSASESLPSRESARSCSTNASAAAEASPTVRASRERGSTRPSPVTLTPAEQRKQSPRDAARGEKRSMDQRGSELAEVASASRARHSVASSPSSAGASRSHAGGGGGAGSASQVERELPALCVGMHVAARWKGDGVWYGATVRSIRADRRAIDVEYDDGDTACSLALSDVQPVGRLFNGASFILTGIGDDEGLGLRTTLRNTGASIIEIDERSGELRIVEGPGSSSSHELMRRVAEGRVMLLSDPPKGKAVKSTMKVFHGLSLGLMPLRPSWVHECLRQGQWTTPSAAHRVPLTVGGSSTRRGAATADGATDKQLLAGYTIVPIGSDPWRVAWSALLRTSGAEVRTDLPPQHRAASGGGRTCLVLVEKDTDRARAAAPLERASSREVPSASQDWVKHCLLEQRILEPRRFPPTTK